MTAAPSLTGSIRVTLALKTVNITNVREHWSKRAGRAKVHRGQAGLAVRAHQRGCKVVPPFLVTLMRIAPRKLDTDGLCAALKAVRDGVADALGIDDGDAAHAWAYEQRPARPREIGLFVGGYGVEIRVESRAA